MNRCKICILPDNYPGIDFDEKGVCNFCLSYKPRKYRGHKRLKEDVLKYAGEKYDCVVCFSGGRDSSYLLWYLAKELGMRVVAYSADNGFIPDQTKINMKRIAQILGVRLVVEENKYLKKCLDHHLKTWIQKPTAASIGMFCVGCRLGIDIGAQKFAVRERIPVVAFGGTPFEGMEYKINIFKKKGSLIKGMIDQALRNPKWIFNPYCVVTQVREFLIHYRRVLRNKNIRYVSPFCRYVRWEEKIVDAVNKDILDWEKNPELESTWRGDCDVFILKSFLYKKALGFNDFDDGLSALIRDKQISREEGLRRLTKEGNFSGDIITKILENLRIDHLDFKESLEKFS